MSTMKNATMSFVLGAAVGSAAALLMAPHKGSVTRQRIRDGGSKAASNGSAAVDQAVALVEGAGHAIDEATRKQASAAGDAFAAAKETYTREKDRV